MATQRRLPRVPEVPGTGTQEMCAVVLAEGDLRTSLATCFIRSSWEGIDAECCQDVAPAADCWRQQEAESKAPAEPHRQRGARVHSPQPYGFADFTTADVLIWDHIFFIVDDFFAHCSRCLGKTSVGIRRCSLVLHRPRAVPKTHFSRHFCEISNGD